MLNCGSEARGLRAMQLCCFQLIFPGLIKTQCIRLKSNALGKNDMLQFSKINADEGKAPKLKPRIE